MFFLMMEPALKVDPISKKTAER